MDEPKAATDSVGSMTISRNGPEFRGVEATTGHGDGHSKIRVGGGFWAWRNGCLALTGRRALLFELVVAVLLMLLGVAIAVPTIILLCSCYTADDSPNRVSSSLLYPFDRNTRQSTWPSDRRQWNQSMTGLLHHGRAHSFPQLCFHGGPDTNGRCCLLEPVCAKTMRLQLRGERVMSVT